MAKQVVETYVDDVDGSSKSVKPYIVGFTDGDGKTTTFAIDLSDKNSAGLREVYTLLVEHGRVITNPGTAVAAKGKGKNKRAAKAGTSTPDVEPSVIRAWAEANGEPFNPRGRISGDLRAKYDAAQAPAPATFAVA